MNPENAEQKDQEEKLRRASPSYLRVTVYDDVLHGEIAGDVGGSALCRTLFDYHAPLDHACLAAWLQHEYAGVLYRLETRLYQGEFRAPPQSEVEA